jgi:hypothetical protein
MANASSDVGARVKRPGGLPLYFKESELEEQFVRGSGRGGQAVARTSNCVKLKHVPSGIVIRCHATRSRETNRLIARKLLQLRLDDLHRGKHSIKAQKAAKVAKKKSRASAKSRLKHAKFAFEKPAAQALASTQFNTVNRGRGAAAATAKAAAARRALQKSMRNQALSRRLGLVRFHAGRSMWAPRLARAGWTPFSSASRACAPASRQWPAQQVAFKPRPDGGDAARVRTRTR